MNFRNFGFDGLDLNGFAYQGRSELSPWLICDMSEERLILLQCHSARNVDVYRIVIEANDNKQMRISAVIWSRELLQRLNELGFPSYQVHYGKNQFGGISTLAYCEFGEDEGTQELARIFLHILSSHQNAFILKPKSAQSIVAGQIDALAAKHDILEPCFGNDWSHKVYEADKAQLRQAFAESRKLAAEKITSETAAILPAEIAPLANTGWFIKSAGFFAIGAVAIVAAAGCVRRYGQ